MEEVKGVDRGGLYREFGAWPLYISEILAMDMDIPDISDVERIYICGMGGSGIVGDLTVDWLTWEGLVEIPIIGVKDYHLPPPKAKDSLVIAISYSGNTRETLGIVDEAMEWDAKLLCISSGGRMKEICRRRKIPHIKVRGGLTPRAALPLLFYPIARLFEERDSTGRIGRDIRESVKVLETLKGEVDVESPLERNPSKELASWLFKGLPIIYGSRLSRSVAIRFKTALNENSKIHALIGILPEVCHNEVEGWEGGDGIPFKAVLLRFPREPPEIYKTFSLLKGIIEEAGHPAYEVWARGETLLSKIISTIYMTDYASLYLAILRRVEPRPVKIIDRLKTSLFEK